MDGAIINRIFSREFIDCVFDGSHPINRCTHVTIREMVEDDLFLESVGYEVPKYHYKYSQKNQHDLVHAFLSNKRCIKNIIAMGRYTGKPYLYGLKSDSKPETLGQALKRHRCEHTLVAVVWIRAGYDERFPDTFSMSVLMKI